MNQTIRLPQTNIKLTLNMPGDGAAAHLAESEPESCRSASKVRIINLAVDLPQNDRPAAQEAELELVFPMNGVSRIQLSSEFKAVSRIGMLYDSQQDITMMGFEPYALFADCCGRNLCFAGMGRLELAGSIRANCYGQSPEGTHAEFLSSIKINRKNLYDGCRLENGRLVYREQLYLDTSNDQALQVIGRYFAWLRQSYDGSLEKPDWGDQVEWHSWYAFGSKINRAVIDRQSEIAASMGIRRIHIDYGWDAEADNPENSGNNRPDPIRFPDFRGLIDRLHSRNQKVSLRWTPFMLHPDNDVGKQLYDCRILPEPVNPYGRYFYPCPRCRETGEFLVREAVRLVREYDIDELWFDMIDDFPELFRDCAGDHQHLPGTAGEHVLRILREIALAVKQVKPDFAISYRREEATPLFRQFVTHIWPHDRYHDYLGNLREMLLIRKIALDEHIHNVCMCWNKTESPEIVARHMLTMIFGGIPAVSVDLTTQSAANLDVINRYIALYLANKAWLNTAERVILCPEDTIRAIRIDRAGESWILCTGTVPGKLDVPADVRRICLFSSSFPEVNTMLAIRGEWTGIVRDCRFEAVGRADIEPLRDGLFVSGAGLPLFCLDLTKEE